jgi:hypothetical protein
LIAKTAAQAVLDDSQRLYDNQVKVVGTTQYTAETGSAGAGTINVSITPKGGSAGNVAILGNDLAIKNKAVADLVAGSTINA